MKQNRAILSLQSGGSFAVTQGEFSVMRRTLPICIALLLALTTACSAPGAASTSQASVSSAPAQPTQTTDPIPDKAAKPLNQFDLDVTLDPQAHQLKVKQTLTYHNHTGKNLSQLYFNLIPQAFQQDGGGTVMEQVSVDGKAGTLSQVKETVYALNLPTDLKADQSTDIQMEYQVKVPNIKNRFGYQENVYNLGNFIATPAVYGKDGWTVEPYVDIGDAFFTEIANYDVTIHVPDGYTVAATGRETTKGRYQAQQVRDFAFCASDGYTVQQETYNGVDVMVYYNGDIQKTAQRVMNTAKQSLDLYSDAFGQYPYDTLSLVLNGLTGGVNGMEYPTLVMLDPDCKVEDLENWGIGDASDDTGPGVDYYLWLIDSATCHEIAHQWFYGVVGNDQIAEPWLDEGACRFAEYLYEKTYCADLDYNGYGSTEELFQTRYCMITGQEKDGQQYAEDKTDLNWSLYDWQKGDPMGYSEIYYKGGSLFYEMEQRMGEQQFRQALREYVSTFAYGTVDTEQFRQFWLGKGDFSKLFALYWKGT